MLANFYFQCFKMIWSSSFEKIILYKIWTLLKNGVSEIMKNFKRIIIKKWVKTEISKNWYFRKNMFWKFPWKNFVFKISLNSFFKIFWKFQKKKYSVKLGNNKKKCWPSSKFQFSIFSVFKFFVCSCHDWKFILLQDHINVSNIWKL